MVLGFSRTREPVLRLEIYQFAAIHDTAEGQEHRLGIGLISTIIAIAGLWLGHHRPAIQLLSAVAITIVLLSTIWPNGTSLWIIVYYAAPGAAAIRGVSRIALMLLIPAGAGVALFAERFRRHLGILALAAICIANEQRRRPAFVRQDQWAPVAVIASALRPDCVAFLYTPTSGREEPMVVPGRWDAGIDRRRCPDDQRLFGQ